MRTLWITACLVLLVPGCLAGEYTTTPDMALPRPDIATPDMTTPDMTTPDMAYLPCRTRLKISTGPSAGCECEITCAALPVECRLISTSASEVCNDKDDNCNGVTDETATLDSSKSYISQRLTNKQTFDNNCDGLINYAYHDSSFNQRNLINTLSGNCSSGSNCSGVSDEKECGTSAVICLPSLPDLTNNLCGTAPNPTNVSIYPCVWNTVTLKCSASTKLMTNPTILCR